MTHATEKSRFLLYALPPAALLCAAAMGQNLSLEVADPDPLGFGSFIPAIEDLDLGFRGKFKGAIHYGIGLEADYNSNFFLSETNEKSEFSALIAPWFRYVSDPEGGASAVLAANYRPVINTFLHNSDLNGVDHSGDISLKLRGSRTEITMFARQLEASTTDRLTGVFSQTTVSTLGIRANRQLASRTFLNAGWTYAMSDYDSVTSEGSEINTAYIGGMWRATERISLGTTLRYDTTDSDNIGSRDAFAVLMEARYRVGERLFFSATLGPEYAETTDSLGVDDDNIRISGSIAAQYEINERWSWTNRLRTATVPSPTETNFLVNDIYLSSILEHRLRKGVLTGGIDCNFSQYEDVGTTLTNRSDEQTYSFFIGYRRNFFSDRLEFDSRIRYAFNDGLVDWDQWFVTTGLGLRF